MAKRKSIKKRPRLTGGDLMKMSPEEYSAHLDEYRRRSGPKLTPEEREARRRLSGALTEVEAAEQQRRDAEYQHMMERFHARTFGAPPPQQVSPAAVQVADNSLPADPKRRKGGSKPLSIWEMVELHFDDLIGKEGGPPYPTLGKARDAVKQFLTDSKKALPVDRTIERRINKHRPNWVASEGA
jgi:hypothetical protein